MPYYIIPFISLNGLRYIYIYSSKPPLKIISLWPDVCIPQENNFKIFSTKIVFLSSNEYQILTCTNR